MPPSSANALMPGLSRGVYRIRHEMVTNALTGELADHLEVLPSACGLHVAVLARTASTDEIGAVVRRASHAGVAVQELSKFAVNGPARPGLVLGYGAIPTQHIEEGLRRLRHCFGP
jgi:GntR family transcriptional regulator/MocR family aminotransferase